MCLLGGLALAVFSSSQVFAVEQGDDFNDGSKNTGKWGSDQIKGSGRLDEVRGHLEYVTGKSTDTDSSDRPWILRQFPSNANWWVQVDATNTTSPVYKPGEYPFSSFGINVRHIRGPNNAETGNEIEVELAAFGSSPGQADREFLSEFDSVSSPNPYPDSAVLPTQDTSASIRLSFDSSTRIFTVSGYTNPGTGYQWVDFGTFGAGSEPAGNGNADWGLLPDDKFVAYVFGYSNYLVVNDAQMYGDNFKEDGGVPWVGPLPGPSVGPTGRFPFRFPINNPLLTAIANFTGNYIGVGQSMDRRGYNLDVAQDESGKLSAMGTIDGYQDKTGSANLSGNVGAVKTVNGEPTVELKGSFAGTRDGDSTTLSYAATAPAKVTDIGGTDGLAGTGSYKGKIAGVPIVGKNVPIQVGPPDQQGLENLKKDWTLQLDITSRQDSKGKSFLVASAELLLPNGDTVVFPERQTKYSAAKGYSLSFKGGTNTRTNLPDKKTSISIKGMTMTQQQDGTWQPDGGTISYGFLGQKGSGNLIDFIAP
jgi:hypothetical protein